MKCIDCGILIKKKERKFYFWTNKGKRYQCSTCGDKETALDKPVHCGGLRCQERVKP